MRSCVRLLAFVAIVLVAGVQSVFAQRNTCKGDIFFKAPADWDSVFVGDSYQLHLMQKEGDWFHLDLTSTGMDYTYSNRVSIGTKKAGLRYMWIR